MRWTSQRLIDVRVSKGRVIYGKKKIGDLLKYSVYDQALSFTFWSIEKIYKIFIPGSRQVVQ